MGVEGFALWDWGCRYGVDRRKGGEVGMWSMRRFCADESVRGRGLVAGFGCLGCAVGIWGLN